MSNLQTFGVGSEVKTPFPFWRLENVIGNQAVVCLQAAWSPAGNHSQLLGQSIQLRPTCGWHGWEFVALWEYANYLTVLFWVPNHFFFETDPFRKRQPLSWLLPLEALFNSASFVFGVPPLMSRDGTVLYLRGCDPQPVPGYHEWMIRVKGTLNQ